MKRPLPFKLSVAALLLDDTARTPSAVLAELAQERADSRLLTRTNVEAALQSLKSAGIVAATGEDDECEAVYALTRVGKARVIKAL